MNTLSPPKWSPSNSKELTTFNEGTAQKGIWICDKGHEWKAEIRKVLQRGSNCPYCQNKTLLKGFNSIQDHKILSKLYSARNVLPANENLYASTKRFLWECNKCGYEWEQSSFLMSKKKNFCPACSGIKHTKDNSIQVVTPQMIKWLKTDTDKTLYFNSRKKITFKCERGHEFNDVPYRFQKRLECPVCNNKKIVKGFNDIGVMFPTLGVEWDDPNPIEKFLHYSRYRANWKCTKCSHSWNTFIYSRTITKSGCPKCSFGNKSKSELEAYDYVKSILPDQEVRSRVRNIVKGYELDIYVPSLKIAIEYNGLYFHSNKFRPKEYHYLKYKACKKAGITLFQIWEDDWLRKNELIKETIAHKLLVSDTPSVMARKTKTKHINASEAKVFLNSHHIQGYSTGAFNLALTFQGEIVAVAVFKKRESSVFELTRYATSVRIPGGFTKLLNFFIKEAPECKTLITFSDNAISDGALYQKNGFHVDRILKEDYMYIRAGGRKHKFSYRKKRFKKDPNLLWDEKLTENELAELNGILKIYDAGKIRWKREMNDISDS